METRNFDEQKEFYRGRSQPPVGVLYCGDACVRVRLFLCRATGGSPDRDQEIETGAWRAEPSLPLRFDPGFERRHLRIVTRDTAGEGWPAGEGGKALEDFDENGGPPIPGA